MTTDTPKASPKLIKDLKSIPSLMFYIFAAVAVFAGLFVVGLNPYGIFATLFLLLLTGCAVADINAGIVPDLLVILIAVLAVVKYFVTEPFSISEILRDGTFFNQYSRSLSDRSRMCFSSNAHTGIDDQRRIRRRRHQAHGCCRSLPWLEIYCGRRCRRSFCSRTLRNISSHPQESRSQIKAQTRAFPCIRTCCGHAFRRSDSKAYIWMELILSH